MPSALKATHYCKSQLTLPTTFTNSEFCTGFSKLLTLLYPDFCLLSIYMAYCTFMWIGNFLNCFWLRCRKLFFFLIQKVLSNHSESFSRWFLDKIVFYSCLCSPSLQWRPFSTLWQCYFLAISASFITVVEKRSTTLQASPPARSVGVMQEAHMTLFQFALQRPVWYVLSAYITSSAAPLLHWAVWFRLDMCEMMTRESRDWL